MCPPVTLAELEPPELPIFCPCFHCTPTHATNGNASLITRIRCLLLNWIHGHQILAFPPCHHVRFFHSFPAEICQVEDMSDDRTLRILSLHDNPEVDCIQMTIRTHKCPTLNDGDQYVVSAFIHVFDAEDMLLEHVKEDGEPEPLQVKFIVTWEDVDQEHSVQEMRSWDKIVELLRAATDAVYDREAKVLGDEECGRRIGEVSQPVAILSLHAD